MAASVFCSTVRECAVHTLAVAMLRQNVHIVLFVYKLHCSIQIFRHSCEAETLSETAFTRYTNIYFNHACLYSASSK